MSLLAPLFLLGALAIALPVWLHRLQTQSSNRQPFSSAMLLETTEQQVHVQKKLKYLLLLAFRIILLLLVALAFAKPFIDRPPEAVANDGAGSDLVVLDLSASMARSGVFDQALAQAERSIDGAEPGSTIGILVAGSSTRSLLPPGTNRNEQRAALTGLEPESGRVDYGQLMAAAESFAEDLPGPVRLHLISDFQASGMPAQFADVIPEGISRLLPYVVGTGEPVNWSVRQLRETPEGIEVIVSSRGLPDRTADIELSLNGERLGVLGATGVGQHTLTFEAPAFEAGDNRLEVTIEADDDLEIDNRWFAVVRNDPPLPVPLITRNPDGLPVTYLSAALEAAADSRYRVEPLTPGEFDPRVLGRYRWAIVEDLGSIDGSLEAELGAFLQNGGNLLAFTGSRSLPLERLPVSGRALAAADLGSGLRAWRGIGSIDTRHPALTNTDGWHRVRVSRSLSLSLAGDEDILVRLDSGAPLLIEEPHGSGRLLLMLSAADNQWNDLPVHPVFVGFMLEAAGYLSGRVAEFGSYSAGSMLTFPASGTGQVIDPDGKSLLSLAATADVQSIRLEKPGVYTVYTANDESLVAANVDPRESELEPITPDLLERWQDATYSTTESGGRAAGTASDPLALWPWVLLLLVLTVIAESALGNVHIATRMKATS